jgi:hypothetical protein
MPVLVLLQEAMYTKGRMRVIINVVMCCVDCACKKELFVAGENVTVIEVDVTITWHNFKCVFYSPPPPKTVNILK